MNIEEALSQEHSKANATAIKNIILRNEKLIHDLMNLFLGSDYRLCQRSAFVVSLIGKEAPELLIPYHQDMVSALASSDNDAILRNTLRIFENISLNEDLEGILFENAYNLFDNPNHAIAIRVFAMTVCTNISKRYPELAQEMMVAIKLHNSTEAKPAYRSRARKCIKILETALK
ncbi:MAG TPA: hypothetical protein P5235_01055 [Saprospiraceae bacterium]|nr:hypothetical protein [Saprospiraceae bacterium]